MIKCLTAGRFNMQAELLKWNGVSEPSTFDVGESPWETFQDPITGEVRNNWVARDSTGIVVQDQDASVTIECSARGYITKGTKGAATIEYFGTDYQGLDLVILSVPARYNITQRDRITNIRSKKTNKVFWLDEEYQDGSRATVFNVDGVVPTFDPFGTHIAWNVRLGKIE